MFSFDTFVLAIQVTIRIPGEVNTFGGISRVASALSTVDSLRKESELPPPKFGFTKGRGYQLQSFQVRSPAETSVLADPAWIAVFLGALAVGLAALQTLGSYGAIKKGAAEASVDLAALKTAAIARAREVVGAVSGLTEQQRREVEIGIALWLEGFANAPDAFSKVLLRAAHFTSVLRRGEALPTFEIQRRDGDA
jgi:hypothetical protein